MNFKHTSWCAVLSACAWTGLLHAAGACAEPHVVATDPAKRQRVSEDAERHAREVFALLPEVRNPALGDLWDHYWLCYTESSPLVEALAHYNERHTGARTFRVVPLSTTQLGSCDAVYVGGRSRVDIETWAVRLRHVPTLTISDVPEARASGVMLVLEPGSGALSVNLDAMQRAHVKPSAQLLSLARHVYE